MSEAQTKTFHVADYVVFTACMLVSAVIGIYYRFTGGHQKTTKEFLMGGKKLHAIPVALSLQASFMSAIFILGTASEVYLNGTMYSWITVSYFIAFPIVAQVFLPVFHKLDFTSAYEYLEKRFNKWARLCGSMAFSLMMILYMAVVLYTPALAFSQVTGLSMWVSILGIGIICTFYTAVGGLKAVVLTDAFQMLVIYSGMIALLIQGTLSVGGASEVWSRVQQGGRLQLTETSFDPRTRHTIWSQLLGGAVMTLTLYAANQAMIQRYLSINKTKNAQRAVYFAMGSTALSLVMVTFLGLIMYAYYYKCDPLKSGQVSKSDQLIPLFVMDVLGHLYGLPGLFTACTFSAALSTVSSGVNSLATVFLCDVIKPIYTWHYLVEMKDTTATSVSKVLAVLFGLVTVGLGFSAGYMGPFVLQIALSIFGVVGGPLLGVFCLALFFPSANSWGAISGLISSLAFMMWLQIGAILNPYRPPSLPVSTELCPNIANMTNGVSPPNVYENGDITTLSSLTFNTSIEEGGETVTGLQDMYRISYMWYSCIAVIITVLVGMLVSAITGFHKKHIDPELLYTCDQFCCCSKSHSAELISSHDPDCLSNSEKITLQTNNHLPDEEKNLQMETSADQ